MKHSTCRGIAAQRGFAIISAIFILVVLAAIGAFAVQVSSMQHIGSAQDVLSVRAYQAARSGLEWALYRVQPANGGNCPVPTNMALAGDTFAGLTVTVTCTGTATAYRITATACNQPNAGACPNEANPDGMYVERRVDVVLRTDLN